MKNHIDVTYETRTKRLVLDAPFHLGDAVRGFPSRRFDPKSRKWRVPLVRANLLHLDTIKHRYDFRFDDAAVTAVMNQEALMAKPKLVPFPLSYDFTRAAVKYSPMGHQSKMLDLAWGLSACAWFAKMGCVAGDTELQVLLGAGKGRKVTIEQLYRRPKSSRTRCRTFKGDSFGQHNVIEVIQSGVKPTYVLRTSCGKNLRATSEHPILTPDGFVPLGELEPGDKVVTYSGDEIWLREPDQIEVPIQGGRSVDKDGYIRVSSPDHPHAWKASKCVYEHRLVAEANLGRYLTPSEHVHHKNGIRHDNRWDNLEVMEGADHLRDHGYHKNFTGVKPDLSTVISVTYHGEEMTYDISMEHPYHNYVANGIVVHNTGKTFTAIHLAFARFQAGQIDAVMILCPSTLRLTWMKELAKYATGEYDFRIHDTKAKWMPEFCRPGKRKELRILAVSVEGLGVSEALYDSACGFLPGNRVMVINDESSRIKNPDAKRTQRAINIGNSADYRVILNGTPIALGIHDLWSQYEFLDPNIIGSGDYWSFKTRYITYGGYENKQIIGYQNVEELMGLIVPYTCEVGKEVLNLPDKMMKTIYVEPTAEQKRLFRAVIKGVDADPNAPNIKVENTLEKRLRLRQITGGYLPRAVPKVKVIDGIESEIVDTALEPLGSNPKFDAMIDMIEDNFVGTKFIIWTPFVHEIEHIAEVLRKKYGTNAVECYYGKTDKSMRSAIEDRYCNDPELRFFIGNPVAAGLGLTLISGENDVMVYYSGTEAYIDRAQSEDRSHRIGQKNTVTVIDMVMVKTVDEIILASIGEKMSVEEYVMTRIAQGVSVDDLMMG